MDVVASNALTFWDVAVNIAIILTPIVIGGGFLYARRQLESTRNARMAQIILSISEQWDSKHMEESRHVVHACGDKLRNRIEEEEGKEDSEALSTLVRVGNFFDSLGLLVIEGFIDCAMAYKLFGRAEEHFYNLYRPTLEEPKYKPYFEYFTELNEAFTKEKARCSPTQPRPVR